jgi:hypothetical protein
MHVLIPECPALWPLLQRLLAVRHAHLMTLEAVVPTALGWRLRYGDPGPCRTDCDAVQGAVRSVHAAGLWVGNLMPLLVLDGSGRVVIGNLGATWDPADPFAGHPSTRGVSDLRIAWRQEGDRRQLPHLPEAWRECPGGYPPATAASIMERLSG